MVDTDIFRKMGLFGIGILTLTQEKIEEFTQEMIKKGEISKEEGKKFVKEVLSEREKQLKSIEDKISQKVREGIRMSGVATKDEIGALEKKIEKLEKTMQSMKK